MRADRLVSLILLLQTRGKQTAQMLSDELGVSRRTILRDVESLSLAGVPIYSDGGHGGGIALDEQYRTTLTGLNAPEVQTLFVTNTAVVLQDVGLGESAERLALKLLAGLPTVHHSTVAHIRQRLLIDPTWWWNEPQAPTFWEELQRAVYEDKLLATTYEHYNGELVERILEPYSLVNKSGTWYLVAQREGELRTYRVARFHKVKLVDQPFVRRLDFDLPTYWQDHLQEFIETFSGYECTLSVHPERVPFVTFLMPGRWEQLGVANSEKWVTLRLRMDSPLMAKMLVFGLGVFGEVLDPPDLAKSVLADAHQLIKHLSL